MSSNFDKLRQLDNTICNVYASASPVPARIAQASAQCNHNTRTITGWIELQACLGVIIGRYEQTLVGSQWKTVNQTMLRAIAKYYTSDELLVDDLVRIDYVGVFHTSPAYSVTIRSISKNTTHTSVHVSF